MKEFWIAYTSDLGGRIRQYQRLVRHARKNCIDAVVIGGDLTANRIPEGERVEKQREFLEGKLRKLLRPLRKERRRVFLMMGNDDLSANIDVLENENRMYEHIHEKRIKLTDDFDIVGYSFVPITPFDVKDWEKFDLGYVPERLRKRFERRKRKQLMGGYESSKTGWHYTPFYPHARRTYCIQRDLTEELFTKRPRHTVYVFHAPPDMTNLDMTGKRTHVGSMAIRGFVEKHQPYLTLHGHIHQTVDITGEFRDRIGRTICMASGNGSNDKLSVICLDLYKPENAERIVL